MTVPGEGMERRSFENDIRYPSLYVFPNALL